MALGDVVADAAADQDPGMSFQLRVTTEGHERTIEAPLVGPVRR